MRGQGVANERERRVGRRAEQTRFCKALVWLKAGGREGRDAVRSGRVEPGRVESFLGVEPSSFDVVSESALSAAGPRVPRGHVPPGFEVPTE